MSKKIDFSYPNEKGQMVHGSAAFNHFVYSVCGGVEDYDELIVDNALKNLAKIINNSVSEEIETQVRRSNIRKIG